MVVNGLPERDTLRCAALQEITGDIVFSFLEFKLMSHIKAYLHGDGERTFGILYNTSRYLIVRALSCNKTVTSPVILSAV